MLILNTTKVVIKAIELNHKKTNGSCGISMIQLMENCGISHLELKSALNTLYQEKKIIVREGINHQLIYLSKNYAMPK